MKIEKITTHSSFDIFCDRCKKQIYVYRICQICKKDICKACGIYTDDTYLISDYFSGDQPDCYCKNCWSAGEKEITKILKLREQKENEETVLFQQWKDKCK